MCNECYTLYNSEYKLSKHCPKSQCSGDLVDIDESIAWYISEINQMFEFYNVPFKTLFSCASHPGSLKKIDVHPYIGFVHEILTTESNVDEIIVREISTFVDILKNILPEKVENENLKIVHTISSDDNKLTLDGDDFIQHRIFIHVNPDVNIGKKLRTLFTSEHFQLLYTQNFIEYSFKRILIKILENFEVFEKKF